MASTDLRLDQPGTLPRPGPVGRLARLAFGLLCVWFVIELLAVRSSLTNSEGHIRAMIWNGTAPTLFLISYVVNIGYSRSWKKWPALASVAILLAIFALGYFVDGSLQSDSLARAIWLWELYLFSHLGLSFLIAAVIGTPGCEMRAFHDLYSRLTGIATKEHYCPVGPLHPIDQWELQRGG